MIINALGYASLIWVIYSIIHYLTAGKYYNIPIIQCLKCSTFWLTLILTFNPVFAAIAALMAMGIEIIESYKTTKL